MLRNTSLDLYDKLVSSLEKYDDFDNKSRFFSKDPKADQKEDDDQQQEEEEGADKEQSKGKEGKKQEREESEDKDQREEGEATQDDKSKRGFRDLSMELLDIGIHQGQVALDYIQHTLPYGILD